MRHLATTVGLQLFSLPRARLPARARAVCNAGVKYLPSQDGAHGVGTFTMIVGAIAMIVPLFALMENSSVNIQLAVLVSGAIIFGCGAIATAIGKKRG